MNLFDSTWSRFLQRSREVRPDGESVHRESGFEELAARWQQFGRRSGELVLVALPNGVVLLDYFFAIVAAGGVPALVSPATPSARLRMLADGLGAGAVVGQRLDGAQLAGSTPEAFGHALVSFRPDHDTTTRPGEVVLLTSGTSGLASACVFDLQQLLLNGARHVASIGQQSDDTVLVSLPLYFSFALVAQALGTWQSGGALVVGSQPFHADTWSRTIRANGVTVSALTPLQVRQVLQRESSWPEHRVLSVGGDTLPQPQVEELLRRRPGRELYLTYGLTQAGPRVSTLATHAEPAHRFTSVGRPLPGVTVELRDRGDCHELLVSSATVMKRRLGWVEGRSGDWARPGVLATGDAFDMDAAGYLYHRGRLADFVLLHGEKVCLASVCRLACECPGVVTARARVLQEPPASCFELLLTVEPGVPPELAKEVAGHLRRFLRPSEQPRSIQMMTAPGSGYK